MRLQATAVHIPPVHGHPNRVPFEGILTTVNTPSDKAPSGARGHRVLLTCEAAEQALPSLLGMAIDYRPTWDGHDSRCKIGILTEATINGNSVLVRGYLYARDFPDVTKVILAQGAHALGMSYEIADAKVQDMRDAIWRLTKVTFTGAAILLRDKAAYRSTSFRLADNLASAVSQPLSV